MTKVYFAIGCLENGYHKTGDYTVHVQVLLHHDPDM